jgi:hypothetical protein
MAIYYGDGSNSGLGRLIKFDQTVIKYAGTYNPNNDPSQDFTSVITLSVTPTDSSTKHLIFWNCSFSVNGGTSLGTRLYAGNSAILIGDASGNRPRVTTAYSVSDPAWFNQDSGSYLYDHNTSSSITYSLRVNTYDGREFSINRSWNDYNSNYMDNARCCSFLNVMEFAA